MKFYYMLGKRHIYIDFVHEKRHMDVEGRWGEEELATVTFLGEKSWKISTVLESF